MCGLFAFTGPAAPDPAVLVAAATAAASRGPHGYGWATQPDRMLHYGPDLLDPAELATVTQPRIIGHCRLATSGDYRDRAGLQPAHARGHFLAHNGTIRNPAELDADAPTDSWALASLYGRLRDEGADPVSALVRATQAADTDTWALLVLDYDGHLLAWRHGRLPLWRLEHPTGVYYASRAFHPDAVAVANETMHMEPAP